MLDDQIIARQGIRHVRKQKWVTGSHVMAASLLALAVTVLFNILMSRYYARWDIGWSSDYKLSDRTCDLLASLEGEINVIVFFEPSNDLFADVRRLLREYEYESLHNPNLLFAVEYVDPDLDVTRAKALAQDCDLADRNVVIFEMRGRRKYVELQELADFEFQLQQALLGREVNTPVTGLKRMKEFRGEQAFSSAIQSLIQPTSPVVYFVSGHGERDTADYNRRSGYSGIARQIRRDNIELRPLSLAAEGEVPADCAALVIAGPDRKYAVQEANQIRRYLEKNGRLFVMADPAVVTGLEDLLKEWGVALGSTVVVGLTRTGNELVITEYGDHPLTRKLKRIVTMFYMPRALHLLTEGPANGTNAPPDRPKVTILAASTAEGWGNSDLGENPPKFDAGTDIPGPVPVAVAVEKGTVGGNIEVEIRPTRLVVIGDSYFVSNGALESGVGGNRDFFMSAINWLLERETLMAVAPKIPHELRLDMDRRQWQWLMTILVGIVPGIMALVGLTVGWRRRC